MGPHFHYFGDYTLGIVMLRTRGFFFTDYLSGLKQKPIKTSTLHRSDKATLRRSVANVLLKTLRLIEVTFLTFTTKHPARVYIGELLRNGSIQIYFNKKKIDTKLSGIIQRGNDFSHRRLGLKLARQGEKEVLRKQLRILLRILLTKDAVSLNIIDLEVGASPVFES